MPNNPQITVIVTCHAEGILIHKREGEYNKHARI